MKIVLCAAPLLLLSANANANQTGEQWQLVKGSDNKDFQIVCSNHTQNTLLIANNSGNNDDRIARNIFIRTLPNNITILSFKRGFVSADKDMTYIPASDEHCTITER